MSRTSSSLLSELIFAAGLIVALAIIFVMARPSRETNDHRKAGREIIRVLERPPLVPAPMHEDPARTMGDELQKAEENARRAKKELEAVKAEIDGQRAELQKLSQSIEVSAERQKKETEDAIRELADERDKLEMTAREASDRAKQAREDLGKLEVALEKQSEQAAERGIAESLGRGRIVDMQTRFDPRTKRDPRMLPAAPNIGQGAAAAVPQAAGDVPAVAGNPNAAANATVSIGKGGDANASGLGDYSDGRRAINFEVAKSIHLDNRLKATEVFFEARRINRATRALEAGPRVTLEQAVRIARVHAPRRLSDLELDPLTGDITWPLALSDKTYAPGKTAVQAKFHDRAAGVTMDTERFDAVNDSISQLKAMLRSNIDRYLSSHYGKARSFLDSLLYEYEKPLR